MFFVVMYRYRHEIDPVIPELGHRGRMDGHHSGQLVQMNNHFVRPE